jgi:hypothetical protein
MCGIINSYISKSFYMLLLQIEYMNLAIIDGRGYGGFMNVRSLIYAFIFILFAGAAVPTLSMDQENTDCVICSETYDQKTHKKLILPCCKNLICKTCTIKLCRDKSGIKVPANDGMMIEQLIRLKNDHSIIATLLRKASYENKPELLECIYTMIQNEWDIDKLSGEEQTKVALERCLGDSWKNDLQELLNQIGNPQQYVQLQVAMNKYMIDGPYKEESKCSFCRTKLASYDDIVNYNTIKKECVVCDQNLKSESNNPQYFKVPCGRLHFTHMHCAMHNIKNKDQYSCPECNRDLAQEKIKEAFRAKNVRDASQECQFLLTNDVSIAEEPIDNIRIQCAIGKHDIAPGDDITLAVCQGAPVICINCLETLCNYRGKSRCPGNCPNHFISRVEKRNFLQQIEDIKMSRMSVAQQAHYHFQKNAITIGLSSAAIMGSMIAVWGYKTWKIRRIVSEFDAIEKLATSLVDRCLTLKLDNANPLLSVQEQIKIPALLSKISHEKARKDVRVAIEAFDKTFMATYWLIIQKYYTSDAAKFAQEQPQQIKELKTRLQDLRTAFTRCKQIVGIERVATTPRGFWAHLKHICWDIPYDTASHYALGISTVAGAGAMYGFSALAQRYV